ncbi:hypothetical protein [Rhizohabitans arisaemae]|uniref:hypothetical protein n=1 Tax=Rhizohabitans arisaemae TaxID=2720610 RepID=UPI0024B134DC|nr:hypothetical protein [Rhizohabitans arisaemae]
MNARAFVIMVLALAAVALLASVPSQAASGGGGHTTISVHSLIDRLSISLLTS